MVADSGLRVSSLGFRVQSLGLRAENLVRSRDVPTEAGRSVGSKPYRATSFIRNTPPWDSTAGPCLGPYGGPREGANYYERGSPVNPRQDLVRSRDVPTEAGRGVGAVAERQRLFYRSGFRVSGRISGFGV